MKNLNSNKMRSLFLLGGVATMMGASMMAPQAAYAADKAKTYKYGAAALGVLGAVLVAKGKTLPGVLAGAGAYYAYKKGADIQDQEDYRDRYYRRDRDRDRYDRRYDDRYRYDNRYDSRYDNRNDYRYDYRDRDYRYNGHYAVR